MVVVGAVAQLPVTAERLELLVQLEEVLVVLLERLTEPGSADIGGELRAVVLAPLRRELPQRPRLAVQDVLLALQLGEVPVDLVDVQPGQVGQDVRLGEPLDPQRVQDLEAVLRCDPHGAKM